MPRAGAAGAAATDDRPADWPPPWPPASKPSAAAPPNAPAKPPKEELAAWLPAAAPPVPAPEGAGGWVGNSNCASTTAWVMSAAAPRAESQAWAVRLPCSAPGAALCSGSRLSSVVPESFKGSSSRSVSRLLAAGRRPGRWPWGSAMVALLSARPAKRAAGEPSPPDADPPPGWGASGAALTRVGCCVAGSLISAMVILRSVVRLLAVR